MNDNLTDINVIVDRSGSMSSISDDVIGGYNTFIEDQRKLEGEANVTFVQFDDEYEAVYTGKPIKDVPLLDKKTYRPRGRTALTDAVARTINSTGDRLEAMDEKDRPGSVIFVIITDGRENASKEFSKAQVQDMIKHQTEKYSWEFIYIGADAAAFNEAGSIGMSAGNAVRFNKSKMYAAYGTVSRAVSNYRTSSPLDRKNLRGRLMENSITDEDRKNGGIEIQKDSSNG